STFTSLFQGRWLVFGKTIQSLNSGCHPRGSSTDDHLVRPSAVGQTVLVFNIILDPNSCLILAAPRKNSINLSHLAGGRNRSNSCGVPSPSQLTKRTVTAFEFMM